MINNSIKVGSKHSDNRKGQSQSRTDKMGEVKFTYTFNTVHTLSHCIDIYQQIKKENVIFYTDQSLAYSLVTAMIDLRVACVCFLNQLKYY